MLNMVTILLAADNSRLRLLSEMLRMVTISLVTLAAPATAFTKDVRTPPTSAVKSVLVAFTLTVARISFLVRQPNPSSHVHPASEYEPGAELVC